MGVRSAQVLKSRSLRLMKTLRVWGAHEEGEVRIRMEWSLIWPVNLFGYIRLAMYM